MPIVNVSKASVEMLLWSVKITPKNVAFAMTMGTDLLEFLLEERGHLRDRGIPRLAASILVGTTVLWFLFHYNT
jgi:hypothetical protein